MKIQIHIFAQTSHEDPNLFRTIKTVSLDECKSLLAERSLHDSKVRNERKLISSISSERKNSLRMSTGFFYVSDLFHSRNCWCTIPRRGYLRGNRSPTPTSLASPRQAATGLLNDFWGISNMWLYSIPITTYIQILLLNHHCCTDNIECDRNSIKVNS